MSAFEVLVKITGGGGSAILSDVTAGWFAAGLQIISVVHSKKMTDNNVVMEELANGGAGKAPPVWTLLSVIFLLW